MAPPDRRNRSIKIVSVLAAFCNCLLWWASCWGYGGYDVLGFLPGGHPYQQFPSWQPHGTYGEVSEEELWRVHGITNPCADREFSFVTDNTTTTQGSGVVEGHVDKDGITRITDVTAGETVDPSEPLTGWVGSPGPSVAQPQPHLHDWIFLRTIDLGASFAAGTPTAVQPYLEFLQLPYVRSVLTGRRIGSLTLEVKFTMQPTAYHFGTIVAGWCPYLTRRLVTNLSGDGGYTVIIANMTRWLMSRKHRVVMNLAKPRDTVIACPLPGQAEVQLLQTNLADYVTPMGEHYLYVSPLTTPNRVDVAYTSVPLEVYVRLVEGSSLYDLTTTATISGSTPEGPLSGLLRTGGEFLSSVSRVTGFKVLDPIAAVAKLGAKGARAMGFGTPVDVRPPPAAVALSLGAPGHADDKLTAANMSAYASTSRVVAMREGQDEMAMTHVASRWSLQEVISMTSAQAANTQLSTFFVDPMYGGPFHTSPGVPTTLQWLSAPFIYWRGGLRYRVTVAGSKYHSGRIRVVYEPAPQFTAASMTLANGTHCFNEVIDVGEGTVVEFEVPWSQAAAWGNVRAGTTGTSAPTVSGTYAQMTSNGRLCFLVETPLSSVAASTPSIQIVVEVAGGSDFELGGFQMSRCCLRPISAKTGGEAEARLRVLGAGVPFLGARASCIGDTAVNLRDICKIVHPVGYLTSASGIPTSTTGVVGVLPVTCFPPQYNNLRLEGMNESYQVAESPNYKYCMKNVQLGPGDGTSPRDYFSVGYAEVSGGLHLVVESDIVALLQSAATDVTQTGLDAKGLHAAVVDGSTESLPLTDWTHDEDVLTSTYRSLLGGFHVRGRLLTGQLDVVIPHQGRTRSIVGWDPCPGGNSTSAPTDLTDVARPDRPRRYTLYWWGPVANSTQSSPLISWAGAEDFNCAYFDGPPPCSVVFSA